MTMATSMTVTSSWRRSGREIARCRCKIWYVSKFTAAYIFILISCLVNIQQVCQSWTICIFKHYYL